ncbi:MULTISPECIES: TetR/AcrR family transcriptional regulator [Streptomyces]|uniref:TetR/AcrR family transcriptional regulator n=1 Tax=Streptomyces TaxID=1883 RepID=UPI001D0507BA|nr:MULTISPECIES: TetR/AcrR family transcriptional regulator [Streptomyces]
MARQERAEQTRHRLIDAAAIEFAAHGYAGTSLHGIVRAAGLTMGALTFHFPSKSALAEAVCEAGAAATREVVSGAATARGVDGVLGQALALAEAFATTPRMHAAARLAREGLSRVDWYASWVPELRTGLERVWREERVESELTPGMVTALLAYVLVAVEATAETGDDLAAAVGGSGRDVLPQAIKALRGLIPGA